MAAINFLKNYLYINLLTFITLRNMEFTDPVLMVKCVIEQYLNTTLV